MKQRTGFTLVELLVVFTVIVILAVIALFSLMNIKAKGRDVKRINDIQQVYEALKTSYGETRDFSVGTCLAGESVSVGCVGESMTREMPEARFVKDPVGLTLCADGCAGPCEYSFEKLEKEDFSLLFYLEKGIGEYSERGCYSLTKMGINKK